MMNRKKQEEEWIAITTFCNRVRKNVKHSTLKVLKEKEAVGIVSDSSFASLNNALLGICEFNQRIKGFITKLNIGYIDALERITTERLEEKVYALEENNKQLKINNATLIKQTSAIQTISDKRISVHGRVYVSEDDIEAANNKFKQCEQALKIKESYIGQLNLQLLNCEEELQSCRKSNTQLELVTKRAEEDNEKVMNLQQQLLELRKNSAVQHENFQKLSSENGRLLEQFQRLDEKYRETQTVFEEDANRMRKRIDELNQSLSKCSKERESFEDQIISLRRQLEQMKYQSETASGEQLSKGEDVRENDPSDSCLQETQIEDAVLAISEESEEDQTHIHNSLLQIGKICEAIEDISLAVEQFSGTQEDKQYLHLKEMIILNVLKLDNIDTDGRMIIRQERKKVIEKGYNLLDVLNSKCTS